MTRKFSCHLTSLSWNFLSQRLCIISHATSGTNLTPSLTDTPYLFTKVSDFGIWLNVCLNSCSVSAHIVVEVAWVIVGISRRKVTLLVKLFTCFLQVSTSSLVWNTDFPRFYLLPRRKFLQITWKEERSFLSTSVQFTIHCQVIIQRCIVRVTDRGLKLFTSEE